MRLILNQPALSVGRETWRQAAFADDGFKYWTIHYYQSNAHPPIFLPLIAATAAEWDREDLVLVPKRYRGIPILEIPKEKRVSHQSLHGKPFGLRDWDMIVEYPFAFLMRLALT